MIVACVLYRSSSCQEYSSSYVEKLQSSVARNLKLPHEFICFSNTPIPCKSVPLEKNWRGWWAKMEVLGFDDPRRILLIDLDTIITGDLTDIASQQRFTMIGGWHGRRYPMGSGFMMLPRDDRLAIFEEFNRRPKQHIDSFRGDQDFISPRAQHAAAWQEVCPGQVVSYKLECRAKHGDTLPLGARVVCFHGKPRPAEMPTDHWTMEHWR